MHVSAKTVGGLRHPLKMIQVRTCTSRTSRTSSARELTGSSGQTYGEEGRALRPSAEPYVVHSCVLWMCEQRSVA